MCTCKTCIGANNILFNYKKVVQARFDNCNRSYLSSMFDDETTLYDKLILKFFYVVSLVKIIIMNISLVGNQHDGKRKSFTELPEKHNLKQKLDCNKVQIKNNLILKYQ